MNESSQQDASDGAFYLHYDDKQHGPLSSAQVRGLYLDGVIGHDTPACQAGMPDWQPLKLVLPELAQAAAPQHAQTQNTLPMNLPAPPLIAKDLQPGGSRAEIAEVGGPLVLSQSHPLISTPKAGWSRKTVVALVSLSLAFVAFGLVGIVWGLRQRNQPVQDVSTSPAHPSPQPAKVGAEKADVSGLRLLETKSKAEQGDASAQYELGSCYYGGRGVPKDYVVAVKWWRKAAEQNFAKAQDGLGICYSREALIKGSVQVSTIRWLRMRPQRQEIAARNSGSHVSSGSIQAVDHLV